MKLYSASYLDLDGNLHTLPIQSKKQINNAFDHIANCCEMLEGSWVEKSEDVTYQDALYILNPFK